jgi:tetratricopeptide (TPR) repeat protein
MQYIDGRTLAAVIAELRRLSGRDQGASEASPVLSAAAEALVRGQTMPEPEPANNQGPTIAASQPRRTDFQSVPPGLAAEETAVQAATSLGRSLRNRAYFEAVARLGVQAAEALEHAHEMGVVHRDIKPGNLMLDARGNLWITDFGLAHCQSQAGLTMTGDLVGTLRYMSPEQALAKRVVVDHRTDIYSLGATLYELLTLEPAFAGSDREELLRQIAFEEPKAPRRLNKAIPPDLETIVLKALAKNPAERYGTAQEVADDLRRFLEHKPIQARRPTLVQRLRKWARRHRAAVWSAVVVVLVAALVGGGEWLRRAQQRAAAEQEVAVGLREAARLQDEGKWPEALAAARRAEAVLAGGAVSAALEEEVRQRRADLEMVATLEEIRLQKASQDPAVGPAYAKAFREYGIDVTALDPVQAGEHIGQKGIRVQLAAALDDWAFLASEEKAKPGRKVLLAIAASGDPDSKRNEVRSALQRGDARALKQLAASKRLTQLPPSTLVLVARTLRQVSLVKRGPRGWEKSPQAVRFAQEAVRVLRKAQELYPGDFWINVELGMQLADGKTPDLEGAIRFATAAVALRPRSFLANNTLFIAFNAKGLVDEAFGAYQKVIQCMPDSTDAKTLSSAYDSLGALGMRKSYDDAIAAYKMAVRLQPDWAMGHYDLGKALQAKGLLDEAIAAYKKVIRLQPNTGQYHFNLANALRDRGLLNEAIAAYKKGIRLTPDDHKLRIRLQKIFNKTFAANKKKPIRFYPNRAAFYHNMGIALYRKKSFDKAIAAYKEAIRLIPNDAGVLPNDAAVHYNLGLALSHKGIIDEAIAAYQKAIQLKPDFSEAYNNLGLALESKKSFEEAIAAYKKAIQLKPDNAQALHNLGLALERKGLVDEAIRAYKETIQRKPDYASAHNCLGIALCKNKSFDEGIAAFKKAIQLKPDFSEAHNSLGVGLLEGKKSFDEAIAAFKKAIQLKPDNASLSCALGTCNC